MSRNRTVPPILPEDAGFARSLVLFEDAAFLVFNKPSGLAVQGGKGVARSIDSLLAAFAKSNGKVPKLVHRIDQPTSGLVIAAKTQPAAAFLSEQFASRSVEKTYLALVSGKIPQEDAGVIAAPLARVEEGGRARMLIAKPGRKGAEEAETAWRVIARTPAGALMEASPKTGRMHQIRVHMMHLGCPILGDALYGRGNKNAARLMLHAWRIGFIDPEGRPIVFRAPVPRDFLERLSALGAIPETP